MENAVENSQIEVFIANLKGRKDYEEKKAIKLGFSNFDLVKIQSANSVVSIYSAAAKLMVIVEPTELIRIALAMTSTVTL